MLRTRVFFAAVSAIVQFSLSFALSLPSLAQEWELGVKPHGTLKVVDLRLTAGSACQNYAEGLVTLDKGNKWTSCLAKNWRWIDDRTIEFRLREGVRFHNGEKFHAYPDVAQGSVGFRLPDLADAPTSLCTAPRR